MTSPSAILTEVANGNEDARRFCECFLSWCHLMDDLLDKDKPVGAEQLAKVQLNWVLTLACNPFFQAHRGLLTGPLVLGANAWLDSMDWSQASDPNKLRATDVLKSQYHEVIWLVAWICGGWEHLRRITRAHRDYDWES